MKKYPGEVPMFSQRYEKGTMLPPARITDIRFIGTKVERRRSPDAPPTHSISAGCGGNWSAHLVYASSGPSRIGESVPDLSRMFCPS